MKVVGSSAGPVHRLGEERLLERVWQIDGWKRKKGKTEALVAVGLE